MKSAPTTPRNLEISSEERDARLKLKPKAPVTGFVDGGWWPRSWDLQAEVPTLAARLAVRLGRVERISYNLVDWQAAPRKITVDGKVIRLAGYRTQRHATVDVIGAHQRLTLLVVAPETMPESAHAALLASGHRGNDDTVENLLSAAAPPADDDGEHERWDLDGGQAPINT
ncbi:DUF5994 family protein [Pseudonocardia sp. TRM90224]|uniref:DUF5994 family protein n=1 Tax=Pseudonocardia sp. TRM90224 TaxID=2812678 RepID=UPI001E38741F|nr:DUF5994 family protein [Pseudonocardia sp. TRM90224]